MPSLALKTRLTNAVGRRALLIEKAASLDYADLKDSLMGYFSFHIGGYAQFMRHQGNEVYKSYYSYKMTRPWRKIQANMKSGQEEANDAAWLEMHQSVLAQSIAEALTLTAMANSSGFDLNTEMKKPTFLNMVKDIGKHFFSSQADKQQFEKAFNDKQDLIGGIFLKALEYEDTHEKKKDPKNKQPKNILRSIKLPTKNRLEYINKQKFDIATPPMADNPTQTEKDKHEEYKASSQGKLELKLDALEKKLKYAATALGSKHPKVQKLDNYIKDLKAELTTRLSIRPESTNDREVKAVSRMFTDQTDEILKLLDAQKIKTLIEEVAAAVSEESDAEAAENKKTSENKIVIAEAANIEKTLIEINTSTLLERNLVNDPSPASKMLIQKTISACIAEINAFNSKQSREDHKISAEEQKSIVAGIIHALYVKNKIYIEDTKDQKRSDQKEIGQRNNDNQVLAMSLNEEIAQQSPEKIAELAMLAGQFATKTAIVLKQEKFRYNTIPPLAFTNVITQSVSEILTSKMENPISRNKIVTFLDHDREAYTNNISINLTDAFSQLDQTVEINLIPALSMFLTEKAFEYHEVTTYQSSTIQKALIETLKETETQLSPSQLKILIHAVAFTVGNRDSENYHSMDYHIFIYAVQAAEAAKTILLQDKNKSRNLDDTEIYSKLLTEILKLADSNAKNILKNDPDTRQTASNETEEIFKLTKSSANPTKFESNSYNLSIQEAVTSYQTDNAAKIEKEFKEAQAGAVSQAEQKKMQQEQHLQALRTAAPREQDFDEIQELLVNTIEENQAKKEGALDSALIRKQAGLALSDPILDSTGSPIKIGATPGHTTHLARGETYQWAKEKFSSIKITLEKDGNVSYQPSYLSRLGFTSTQKKEILIAVTTYFQDKENIKKSSVPLKAAPSVSYVKSFLSVMEDNFGPPAKILKKIALSEDLRHKLKNIAGGNKKSIEGEQKNAKQKAPESLLDRIDAHNKYVDDCINEKNASFNITNNKNEEEKYLTTPTGKK